LLELRENAPVGSILPHPSLPTLPHSTSLPPMTRRDRTIGEPGSIDVWREIRAEEEERGSMSRRQPGERGREEEANRKVETLWRQPTPDRRIESACGSGRFGSPPTPASLFFLTKAKLTASIHGCSAYHLPCPTVRASHQWLPRGAVLLRTCLPDISCVAPTEHRAHAAINPSRPGLDRVKGWIDFFGGFACLLVGL
jgi:hypothetical protein